MKNSIDKEVLICKLAQLCAEERIHILDAYDLLGNEEESIRKLEKHIMVCIKVLDDEMNKMING